MIRGMGQVENWKVVEGFGSGGGGVLAMVVTAGGLVDVEEIALIFFRGNEKYWR